MSRQAVRERWDRWAVSRGEASSRRVWPAFPHTIRLDHPATADVRPRYGFGRPAHPELDALIRSGSQLYSEQLKAFVPFFDDLARIPLVGELSPEPCWIHPWLIGLDTISLYAYTRIRRPRNYVEIGSGQSTKVVARALRDGNGKTVITSIDPNPRSEIDPLCDKIIRQPLERVDTEACFGALGAGDILFFDGSHRLLPNSDCVVFFLEVLPRLPPGVLVGIHDVYLPDDYPQPFFEMWWSEQYVLAALLLAGWAHLEIVLPTFFASGKREMAAMLDPLFARTGLRDINPRGSAFWVQTR